MGKKIFIVSWKKGSKSGNGYVKAEDIVKAQQKAIDELWLCLEDIVDITEYKSEADIKEGIKKVLTCSGTNVCYAGYGALFCRIF